MINNNIGELNETLVDVIEKYVEYDGLSRKWERKRDRLKAVENIRQFCSIHGIHSREYIEFYYMKLRQGEHSDG